MVKHEVRPIAERRNFAGTSDVMKIPLDRVGGLKRLDVYLEIANGAGAPVAQELKNIITKVRICDVYNNSWCDCSGADLYALQTLRDRQEPDHLDNTTANVVQHVRLSVLLGIPGQNENYGLDLSKAIDPFLELTINLAASTPVGANGYLDKGLYVTLSGDMTAGLKAPNYKGAITPGRLQSVTTKVENPLSLNDVSASRLVSLAMMAYLAGTSDGSLISNVAIEEKDTGKKIVNSDFLSLMASRPQMDGSTLDHWLSLLYVPGRLGEAPLQVGKGTKLAVQLNSLVAAGEVRLIAEHLI